MSSLTPHSSRSPASRAIAPLVRAGGVGGGAHPAYRPPFPPRASTATATMPQSTAMYRVHDMADSTRLTSCVRRLRRTRLRPTDRTFRLRADHLAYAPPNSRLQPAQTPLRAHPTSGDRARPRRPLRTGDSAQASAVTCAPRRLRRAYVLRVASNARACRPHARAHAVSSSGALRRRRDLHAELRTDVSDSTTRSSAGRDPQCAVVVDRGKFLGNTPIFGEASVGGQLSMSHPS
ncbi:hypothetical protein B0H10DRAFT_2437972 [Mycena sp. CBHHK59/15]|nr:hypothetical protein B0H10DRAFT_2437972 [Mycena sp. CBHHK59/15]